MASRRLSRCYAPTVAPVLSPISLQSRRGGNALKFIIRLSPERDCSTKRVS